jgi:hypothetical protein
MTSPGMPLHRAGSRRLKRLNEQKKMHLQGALRRVHSKEHLNGNASPSRPNSPNLPKRRRTTEHRVQNDDDAPSGSEVSAPDWPPVKQTKSGHKKKKAVAAPPSTKRAASDSVKDFLQTNGDLNMHAWENVDEREKQVHDALMQRQTGPTGRQLDEYDQEYDRGKVKKVRNKEEKAKGVGAKVFDAILRVKSKVVSKGKRQLAALKKNNNRGRRK